MINYDKLRNRLNKPETLNEATYYGKNPMLLKAEKIIEEMKKTYSKTSPNAYDIDEDVFYNLTGKLEKIFKDLFGFSDVFINKSVYGNCIKSFSKSGAFTFTKSFLIFDINKRINGDYDAEKFKISDYHNGVKFKPNSNVKMVMVIDNALFTENDIPELNFSPSEILAIMLHEIGHNFYDDKNRIYASNAFTTIFSIPIIIPYLSSQIMSAITLSADGMLMDGTKNDKSLAEFISKFHVKLEKLGLNTVLDIGALIDKVQMMLTSTIALSPVAYISIIIQYIISQLTSPNGLFNIILGKDSEVYADSFATAFGYGADLSSALVKLPNYSEGYYSKIKYSSKEVKNFLDLFDSISHIMLLPFYIVFNIIDPHPIIEKRIINNMNYLKACADNIDNPRLKKEYLDDIKNINKVKAGVMRKATNNYSFDEKMKAMTIAILDSKSDKEVEKIINDKKFYNLDM